MIATAALLGLSGCDGDDGVVARGWVEGREVDVAPMAAGRILAVLVDEGDTLEVGDTVALLSRDATLADAEVARGRADAALARLQELERGARAEDIAAAQAELQGAEAELLRARRELARVEALDSANLSSDQLVDEARTLALRAASRRDVAREALARLRRGARPEQIAAARAELEAARAALTGALSTAGELLLVSPVAGPVLVRSFEPGEVVAAGAPVVTVLGGRRALGTRVAGAERPGRGDGGRASASRHRCAARHGVRGDGHLDRVARGVHAACRADRRGARRPDVRGAAARRRPGRAAARRAAGRGAFRTRR